MGPRIPSVHLYHKVAAETPSSSAEKHLAVVGLWISHSHARLRQLDRQAADGEYGLDLFAGRHVAQQIQPYFHRARIGVGIRLGMFHPISMLPRFTKSRF